MDFKKVSLVYFSATDVDKKYARAMGKATGKEMAEYDMTLPANRVPEKAPSFGKDDLVILALPVYGGRIPAVCLDYVKALKGEDTPCVVVACYGNRDFDDALVEMEDLMTERGFKVVGGAALVGRHSFSSEIAGNRPDQNDLECAAEYMKALCAGDGKALEKGVLPGNRPYKENNGAPNTILPSTTDACINCKLCARNCPNGVISFDNPKEFVKDASYCLRCNRCVVNCPRNAKVFDNEQFQTVVAGCIKMFGKPDKENKYFM